MQRTQDKIVTLTKSSPEYSNNSGAPDGEGASLKGKPAPAFTLVDLNGKKVSLAQFQGASRGGELLGDVVRAVQAGDAVV